MLTTGDVLETNCEAGSRRCRQKSSEAQAHVVCAPESRRGQRARPGRRGASVGPSSSTAGASPPRAVHTRSGALCSRAPERSRALLWVLTAQRWLQVASGRAAPLRPEAPSGPRGWPGAVPASYLARRRTHVPFGWCLTCSARPKAHPPPPSDP